MKLYKEAFRPRESKEDGEQYLFSSENCVVYEILCQLIIGAKLLRYKHLKENDHSPKFHHTLFAVLREKRLKKRRK